MVIAWTAIPTQNIRKTSCGSCKDDLEFTDADVSIDQTPPDPHDYITCPSCGEEVWV